MSAPNPFPCGGAGQRPCPPTPATAGQFTPEEVNAYGEQCYQKGLRDAIRPSEPQKDDI
jgi:hypothetical protein